MEISRRHLLRNLLAPAVLGLFLRPLRAFAEWNRQAFSATSETGALREFFGGADVQPSDAVSIGASDLVENGAFVPVRIETTLPAPESITILVEHNPNPLIASFNLGPGCRGVIATRIKVAKPSDIVAVVKSGGRLYSTRKFVKVIKGGCG